MRSRLLRAIHAHYSKTSSRSFSSGSDLPRAPVLPNGSVETFRRTAFNPQTAALFPPKHFVSLPASTKWFKHSAGEASVASLNYNYLSEHGAEAIVPLEYTKVAEDGSDEFQRLHAPLSVFLVWTQLANNASAERMYLAQCQIADLPFTLKKDLPTPDVVAQAGRGDIYDTNAWIGLAPTNTPLHRDPNPNLFVQLAGRKVVRMCPPETGLAIFSQVQSELGRDGNASIRDDGMMYGREKALLDKYVWAEDAFRLTSASQYEAHLGAGDGIFIPQGWWHSIKGVGDGITASVNWWFR